MDSVGCGAAPDAADFGDLGSNTLGHIAQICANGGADQGRQGALHLPNLARLGLWNAARLASDMALPEADPSPAGRWGAGIERSRGKDTPSGHWELAGVPVPWDWTYFPKTTPCFPKALTDTVQALAQTDGVLGNCHASGLKIIADLGAEHLTPASQFATLRPILFFKLPHMNKALGLSAFCSFAAISRQNCTP